MDCAFFFYSCVLQNVTYCSFHGSPYSICLTYYSNCAPTLSVKKSSSTTPVASYKPTTQVRKKINDYCIGALQTIEYSLQVMTPGMKKMSLIKLKKPFQLQPMRAGQAILALRL